MPQETNLNVSPYFDDFDANKDYYKVLFKPGYPIQARELTTLQSILQNQVEQFGNHIFKEGSVVIPGQLSLDIPLYAVEIESTFNGSPISLYFEQLLGITLRGAVSGVSARVIYILDNLDSERGNYTLYLQYLESGGANFSDKVFSDGETLIAEKEVSYGNFTIPIGQGVCNTISTNATSGGSSVKVASGIYFVRGTFVKVKEQRIILDQYGVNPTYKVGFNVIEKIITPTEDGSLFDNAQGFSNYAAPGADRFQIELELIKVGIDEEVDNFVEILRILNGAPQFFNNSSQYSLIRDELAKRTSDSNGDFYVKPFTLFVQDSLNDRVLTNGIYFEGQNTVNGNTPSEDTMVYQIGPGKAYVNGYDVENIAPRLLDVQKPRTTKTLNNEFIAYNAGNLFVVNNAYGSASIGLGNTSYVSLMDSRIGSQPHVASGSTIGFARVYDFIPESNYVDDASRLSLRLFDIQTFTTIGLTTSITQSLPAFIRGKKSNASGYLRTSVSGSSTITLYQVSGKFLENEPISINGIDDGRLIKSVRDYSISDIKSVYSQVGVSTFNADLVLDSGFLLAPRGTIFNITQASGGISTVSAGLGTNFINKISVGDIISYSNPNTGGDVIYNKVNSVSAGGTNFAISSVENVSSVCSGNLPTTTSTVTNISKITASSYSRSSSLLTKLSKENVSSISLEDNEIIQRRIFSNVSFSNNSITINIPASDIDIFFDSFDEDKFVITYSDGSVEPLRRDKYILDTSGKQLTFNGLTKSSGIADVIATVKNFKPSSKIKKLNKTNTLLVSNSKLTSSGIGTTTLNDGLTYSQVYGTRVQDEEISLNVPDILNVLAVYESSSNNDPSLPNLKLSSFTGPTNNNQDFIIGEQITGKTSSAVGLIISRISTDIVEYVYLNTKSFIENEVIVGKESSTQALVTDKGLGDKNITQNFIFDDGQRQQYYDYGRITRKKNVLEPSKKIKIIFQNYTIDSSDTGEFITANSYLNLNFKTEVPSFNQTRVSDYIDIRPRVAPYTLSSKSPFEFESRVFTNSGQYSQYILSPDENIKLNYSYYVGRTDIVLLNPDGTFEVVYGIPNDTPLPPVLKHNTFQISTISLPPYLYDVRNAVVNMSQHKRYRMSDISLLEDRIQRVEEFTTLTALESKTENFSIKDAETGLDRFKCGFFVDDFKSHSYHDLQHPSFKSCIDKGRKHLRPLHYTTCLDLQLGSEVISGVGQTFSPNKDQSYVTDLGSPGVRKTGDLITLDYTEKMYDQQLLATKTESVTPFLVRYWNGFLTLNPPIDTWIDEKAITTTSYNEIKNTSEPLPDQNITVVENVTEDLVVYTNEPIGQNGDQPFDYLGNARRLIEENPTAPGSNRGLINRQFGGQTMGLQFDTTLRVSGNTIRIDTSGNIGGDPRFWNQISQFLPPDAINRWQTAMRGSDWQHSFIEFEANPQGFTETRRNTTTTSSTNNTTTAYTPEKIIQNDTVSESLSHYTQPVRYLRSRNIEFDAKGLKPRTTFYSFLQGIDIKNYVIPKLLEIEMISGTFQIGETIESDPHFTSSKIRFRLCKPNHRTGPSDGSNPPDVTNPIFIFTGTGTPIPASPPRADIFTLNPYTQQPIQDNYTSSSTFLNVDTRSLELQSEVQFYGQVARNMRLIGKTSGAVARVSNIRLVTDNEGRLIGSVFIPDANTIGNPRWINGENTFTLVDTEKLENVGTNEFVANSRINESGASAQFTSSGIVNISETNILTTRNITIIPPSTINTTTITNTTRNITAVTQTATSGNIKRIAGTPPDPLAQSFYVFEDTGIFLTSVDVWFETKDETNIPVTLQIRPLIAGVPSNVVVPFSEVTLTPNEVNLSIDGTVSTTFRFPSPVYLTGPKQQTVRQSPIASETQAEYAIVLISNSSNYRVFITELGQNDILSGVKVSIQPSLGSLFKSQNGSTWTPAQLEDLKYRINRADFVNEGLVRFYNPKLSLGNKKVTVTGPNQIQTISKRIIVGLGSTGYDSSVIKPGVTITQGSASSTLIGIAGSITIGTGVTVANAGVGYTPTSGSATYSDIDLTTETGYGQGAKATVGVSNGSINSVSITSGGTGYQVGDSLLIPNIGQNVGFGGRVVVSTISSNNTFVLDNVQGTFSVGINTVSYANSSGVTTYVGAAVTISNITSDQYYTGTHLKIYQQNHGMHSSENYVRIGEMRPPNSEINSRTTSAITSTEVNSIALISSTGFDTFEGVAVSTSNPGYVIIGNEVIKYTGVSGNSLTTLTRAVGGTQAIAYDSGVYVYRYQFNGVSLRRINKVHNFAEVNTSTHPINLDSYHIKIDMDSTDFEGTGIGSDRTNNLYFNSTIQTGSRGTVITNNIQYESITPQIANIIPTKTDITPRIRTFTGTSVGGNEKSFADSGFEDISLHETTYFTTPRLICSDINEQKFITESPGNRSLTMEFLMQSSDSRVSPVIDIIRTSVITTSNLINNPIGIQTASLYADDDSSRSLYNDKHNTVYISKPVRLKLPANSIKVLLSASRNDTNDIRVLYQLFRDDAPEVSQNFEFFPGYSNYKVDGFGIKRVVDSSRNDGSSDSLIKEITNRSFKDYEYSVDDLPDFNAFAIKIVMAGTNQATPPIISSLRAIATVKPRV